MLTMQERSLVLEAGFCNWGWHPHPCKSIPFWESHSDNPAWYTDTAWNSQRFTKRKNDGNLVTWSVRSLITARTFRKLTQELKIYKFMAAEIQETWWQGVKISHTWYYGVCYSCIYKRKLLITAFVTRMEGKVPKLKFFLQKNIYAT